MGPVTYDAVAVLEAKPTEEAMLTALAGTADAAGGLGVRVAADDLVLQLCDDRDEPLVSIEEPYLVHVPGEVERLIGSAAASRAATPVWWLEIRAIRSEPARLIARTFGDELARLTGGSVWYAGWTGGDVPYPWEDAS
jgi:hypothetical protein